MLGSFNSFFLLKMTHQLFILILHFQTSCNTVAGVQESFALGMLHQVVHKQSHHVHT